MKKTFSMIGMLVVFLSVMVMACKNPNDPKLTQEEQIKLIAEKSEAMGSAGEKAEKALKEADDKAKSTGLTQEHINSAKTAVMAYKTTLNDYLATVSNIATQNGNASSENMKKLNDVMNTYIKEVDAVIGFLSEANTTDKKGKVTEAKTKFDTATNTWINSMRSLV